MSQFKFPNDVLTFATNRDNELTAAELAFAFRCLCASAKEFYGRGTKNHHVKTDKSNSKGRPNLSSKIWKNGTRKLLSDRRFQLLLTDLLRLVDRFKPNDLLDSIHSLNVLGFKDRQLMDIAEGFLIKELPTLPASTLAKVLLVLGELNMAEKSCMTSIVIELLMQTKDQIDTNMLSRIACIICHVSMYHVKFLNSIYSLVEQRIGQMTPYQVSSFAYAYSRVPKLHNGALLTELLQQALSLARIQIGNWDIPDICRVIQSAGRANNPPLPLFEVFEEPLLISLTKLNPRNLNILTSSFQKSRCGSQSFWSIVLQSLIDRKSQFETRNLAGCLVSTSKCVVNLGPELWRLMEECENTFLSNLRELLPSDVAQLLMAFGVQHVGSNQFFDGLGEAAKQFYDQWSPEQLAGSLFSLAQSRRDHHLFVTVHVEVLSRILQFDTKQLSQVCWAFSVAGLFERSFWQAILQTIETVKEGLDSNEDAALFYPALLNLKRIMIEGDEIQDMDRTSKTICNDGHDGRSHTFKSTLSTPLISHDRLDPLLMFAREAFLQSQFKGYELQDVRQILQMKQDLEKQLSMSSIIPFFRVDGLIIDLYLPDVNVAVIFHSSRSINRTTKLPLSHSIIQHHILLKWFHIGVVHLNDNVENINSFQDRVPNNPMVDFVKKRILKAEMAKHYRSEKHHEVEIALKQEQGEKSWRVRKFLQSIIKGDDQPGLDREQSDDQHREEYFKKRCDLNAKSSLGTITNDNLSMHDNNVCIYHVMKPSKNLKQRMKQMNETNE